jgi:hypothetical protein
MNSEAGAAKFKLRHYRACETRRPPFRGMPSAEALAWIAPRVRRSLAAIMREGILLPASRRNKSTSSGVQGLLMNRRCIWIAKRKSCGCLRLREAKRPTFGGWRQGPA